MIVRRDALFASLEMDEATLYQLWLANEVPLHLHEHHDRAFSLWQERVIDALPSDILEPFEDYKRRRNGADTGSWWQGLWPLALPSNAPSLPGAQVIYPLLAAPGSLAAALSLSAWAVPALSVTRTAYQGYKLYRGLSAMLWG